MKKKRHTDKSIEKILSRLAEIGISHHIKTRNIDSLGNVRVTTYSNLEHLKENQAEVVKKLYQNKNNL